MHLKVFTSARMEHKIYIFGSLSCRFFANCWSFVSFLSGLKISPHIWEETNFVTKTSNSSVSFFAVPVVCEKHLVSLKLITLQIARCPPSWNVQKSAFLGQGIEIQLVSQRNECDFHHDRAFIEVKRFFLMLWGGAKISPCWRNVYLILDML